MALGDRPNLQLRMWVLEVPLVKLTKPTTAACPCEGTAAGCQPCARASGGALREPGDHRNQESPWARCMHSTVKSEFALQRSQLTPTILPAPSLNCWPLVLIMQVGTWEPGKPVMS